MTLNLNSEGDYYVGGSPQSGFEYEYIMGIKIFHSFPPTLSSLRINDSLVEAEDLLVFLNATHRPSSLTFIKTDLYSEMSHSSKVKTVLRCLHSLGIRYEIAPFEVYFHNEDVYDESSIWNDEVRRAGPVLKWDGGEWTELNIPSEDESEATSDGEESEGEEGEEGNEAEEEQ